MDPLEVAPEKALEELQDLYDELDSLTTSWQDGCIACGICCHFDVAEHILYATDLELAFLVRAHGVRRPTAPKRCPWQDDGECTAREGRVLGCRLHYCERTGATAAELEHLSQLAHDRLHVIHDNCDSPWHYAPLLDTLTEMVD